MDTGSRGKSYNHNPIAGAAVSDTSVATQRPTTHLVGLLFLVLPFLLCSCEEELVEGADDSTLEETGGDALVDGTMDLQITLNTDTIGFSGRTVNVALDVANLSEGVNEVRVYLVQAMSLSLDETGLPTVSEYKVTHTANEYLYWEKLPAAERLNYELTFPGEDAYFAVTLGLYAENANDPDDWALAELPVYLTFLEGQLAMSPDLADQLVRLRDDGLKGCGFDGLLPEGLQAEDETDEDPSETGTEQDTTSNKVLEPSVLLEALQDCFGDALTTVEDRIWQEEDDNAEDESEDGTEPE